MYVGCTVDIYMFLGFLTGFCGGALSDTGNEEGRKLSEQECTRSRVAQAPPCQITQVPSFSKGARKYQSDNS